MYLGSYETFTVDLLSEIRRWPLVIDYLCKNVSSGIFEREPDTPVFQNILVGACL